RVDGETGAQRGDARDVVALRAVRLAAAEDHLFHFLGIEPRRLAEHVLDGVGGEIVGTRHVEAATVRLRERCARAGDDDRFSHGGESFLGGGSDRVSRERQETAVSAAQTTLAIATTTAASRRR